MRNLRKRIASAGLAVTLALTAVMPGYSAEAPVNGQQTEKDSGSGSGAVSFQTEDGVYVSYGDPDDTSEYGDSYTVEVGDGTESETGETSGQESEPAGDQESEPAGDQESEPAGDQESEPEEDSYIVYLPEFEGVSYSFDEEAYDEELSGEDYSVLIYNAGDDVAFHVDSSIPFVMVNADTLDTFADALVEDNGDVSFVMPEFDLIAQFASFSTEDTEIPAETETETEESEPATEAEIPAEDCTITADGTEWISYEFGSEAYAPGDTVQFKVASSHGFVLDEVSAETADGELEMELVDNESIGKDEAPYAISTENGAIGLVETDDFGDMTRTYEFVMPEEDVSIFASHNDAVMLASAEDDIDSFTVDVQAGNFGGMPKAWADLSYQNTNWTATTYKYVKFKRKGKDYTTIGYCVEPRKGNPGDGKDYKVTYIKKDKLEKALYYLYDGPGWNSKNKIKQWLDDQKVLDSNTSIKKDQYFGISHYVLSYIYNKNTFNPYKGNSSSVGGAAINAAGVKAIEHIVSIIDGLPDIENPAFSETNLKGTWNDAAKVCRTQTVTFTGTKGVSIQLEVGSGVTVVNESTGVHSEGHGTIATGQKFHLESLDADGAATYVATSPVPVDFEGLRFDDGNKGTQTLVVAYVTNQKTLSINVTWESRTTVNLLKILDGSQMNMPISEAFPFDGAVYGVWTNAACSGEPAYRLTFANGATAATVQNVPRRDYWIKEIQVPSCNAYLADTNVLVANAANNWTVFSSEPLKTGPLTIHKDIAEMEDMSEADLQRLYDSGILANVIFELKHTNEKLGDYGKRRVQCDKYGNATVEDLFWGDWTVTEVQTPDTYHKVMDTDTITVDTDKVAEYKFGNINQPVFQEVRFIKKDARTGNPIPGVFDNATIKLYKAKTSTEDTSPEYDMDSPLALRVVGYDEPITELKTDGTGTIELKDPLPGGKYLIVETDPPKGYEALKDGMEFTVTSEETQTVEIFDEPVTGKLQVTKRDDKTGETLGAGYTFEVIVNGDICDGSGKVYPGFEDGTVVDTITTGEDGIATSRDDLLSGDYFVREVAVSGDGHAITGELYPANIPEDPNNNEPYVVPVDVQNEETTLKLFKTDSVTGTVLEGIKFRIKIKGAEDDDSQVYVTDEYGELAAAGLKPGTYTVQEIGTIPGYNLNDKVFEFTVDKDGLIDCGENTKDTKDEKGNSTGVYKIEDGVHEALYGLSVVNNPNVVHITKRDITNGEEVPGATLRITDASGMVWAEWVSTTEPHQVTGLPAGQYTLTEILPPQYYELASSIQFTVEDKDNLEVQPVEMFDNPYREVEISKKDITGGDEIPDAHLVIHDENGDVVEEWVSGEEPHMVKLHSGRYTLTERKPADGYVTAEEIEFEVLQRGEGDFDIQHVEMFDDVTKVEISKQDVTNSQELPGAHLVIKDEDGETVEEWTSTNEPHYIEMLPIGKYTLTEITAPNGYEVAETVNFEVMDTAEIQHVVMYDSPTVTAPKTGDDFDVVPLAAIIAVVVVLIAAAVILIVKGKSRKADAKAEPEATKNE